MAGEFPIEAQKVVATLAALLDAQGQSPLAQVLKVGTARIESTDYDNWNGGTYYYSLFVELPVGEYAKVEPTLSEVEKALSEKLQNILRLAGNDILNTVVITPVFEESSAEIFGAAAQDAERIWERHRFRLFLSHVSAHKVEVSSLKWELHLLGVDGFVAHEDIEPTLEWQAEIELALGSMDAMAALLTEDFPESKWTDQEVGVAYARGVFVLPVRVPLNPYGFIAKTQGLRGDLTKPDKLAAAIVGILLKRSRTATQMREALVFALESSRSFAASKVVTTAIESTDGFTRDQLTRIQNAAKSNHEVANAFGVPDRLRSYIALKAVG